MTLPKLSFSFWTDMEPRKRTAWRLVAGVVVCLFALFTAIAVLSYFFTWKQDASLLSGVGLMDGSVPVGNSSSALGFRWGHFFVTHSFGFGALAVLAFLVALSVRFLAPKLHIPVGKWFLASFSGASGCF